MPLPLLCISLQSLCLTTGLHAVLHYHVAPACKEVPLPNCVDKHSSGEHHPQGCYYICSHQPGCLALLLYFFKETGNFKYLRNPCVGVFNVMMIQYLAGFKTLAAPFDIMCQVCLLSQCQSGICKLLSVRRTGLTYMFPVFYFHILRFFSCFTCLPAERGYQSSLCN